MKLSFARHGKSWSVPVLFLVSLTAATAVNAATFEFTNPVGGGEYPTCSGGTWSRSGSTYTCTGSITLASGDNMRPGSDITVVANNGFTLNGNNTIGSATDNVNLQTAWTGITAGSDVAIYGNVAVTGGAIVLQGGSVSGSVSSDCCAISTTNTDIGGGISSGSNAVAIDGGTITGAISGIGVSIQNATVASGSITSSNPISISNSTVGSSGSSVTITGSNTVTLSSSTTVYGSITAGAWPGTLSIDGTSSVVGTCTPSHARCTAACTSTTVGSDTVVTCIASGSIAIPANVSSVRYLIVAGGGGGGGIESGINYGSGGGGGGGVLSGTSLSVSSGTTYNVTVGGGGSAGVGGTSQGGNGGSSTFAGLTATGGGGGASRNVDNDGKNGGSGGGGRSNGNGGNNVNGQGYDGGDGDGGGAGGGGGAGQNGSDGNNNNGGNGGNGVANDISGIATYYGGGGGGGGYSNGGDGGQGGGANAPNARGAGTAGTAKTGGGGSGASGSNSGSAYSGGTGGSGIVIIRYPTAGTGSGSSSCLSGTISGVVNTYYPVSASLSAGATTLSVGTPTGASTALAQNDLVLIVQMQDAGIDTTNTSSYGTASNINAGKYEYAVVASVAGSTVTLTGGLTNSYTQQTGSSAVAQKTIQLIRVPVFSSATLGSGTTASAWDGSTGGILAFDVTGALALNSATVDVSGKGFRGGGGRQLSGGSGSNTDYLTLATNDANASKGEGIAGTPRYLNNSGSLQNTGVEGYPNGSYARGAPANAGGGGTDDDPANNDENTGGGGGANAGGGGYGGYAWSASASPGRGIGGAAVTSSASRLLLGGGGGSGTTNNGTGSPGSGFASSGAAGGGLVMIRAGSLTGTATINVNGANANNTVLNDGSGGGGAGGTVIVYAGSGVAGLSVTAAGGNGGTNTGGGSDHGPGGGGGGGYVISSSALSSCTVSGGAAGTTAGGGNYGATAGSAGLCATTLTAGQIVGKTLGSGPCAGGLDHIRIEHNGSGVTCAPTTLTVKACANTSCSSLYTGGGVTGTLTASGTPTVNWVDGASFSIGASGSTTESVQVTTAGTVTWGTTGESPTPGNATSCYIGATASCSFTASLAGFLFDVPNHFSDVQQSVTVSAVKQADNSLACTPAFAGTSKTVNFNCGYSDPASGTLPVTVGGSDITCGSASGVSLAFDATGVATTTVRYADVGQMNLTASYTGASGSETGLVMAGSDTFIAAPASFTVVPTGPYVAGTPFGVTVTAKNASGNTTPNFGAESTTENVTLGHTLTGPAGGNDPALEGTTTLSDASFDSGNGVATASDVEWDEVGDIGLTATLASASYLGSGLTATGSGAVGPFKPAYFETAVTPGTGTFTYADQPFTVTVTAMNADGGTTRNYEGAYARAVTLTDANSATNNSGTLGSFSNATIAAASFADGVGATSTIKYAFANKETAPLEAPVSAPLALRATDADGVTSSGHAEGTTPIRSGRLWLTNAYGSEHLPLAIPAEVQFYNGTYWAINTQDSSNTASWSVSPAGATALVGSGSTTLSLGANLSSGRASLTASAPGNGGYGYLDVTVTVPSYLTFPWDGCANMTGFPANCLTAEFDNPGARATFGIHKGNRRIIHRR